MTVDRFIKDRMDVYNGSAFTDTWCLEASQRQALPYALKMLETSAQDTYERDILTSDLMDALDYIGNYYPISARITEFKEACQIRDADQRQYAVLKALQGIKRSMGF